MRNDEEHRIQMAVFRWASCWRELDTMFAIPNGGARNPATGARLKAEGVKRGVPDIFLPIPRNGFHGLFIEMKVLPKKPSPEQNRYIEKLRDVGYAVHVCFAAYPAMQLIADYMGWPSPFKPTKGDTTK